MGGRAVRYNGPAPMTTSPLQVREATPPSTERQRDRLALILEVARASSSLDLPDLIAQVGACFHRSHWRWDHTSLFLYEPAEGALRVHSFFFGPGPLADLNPRRDVGMLIPIEGTQSGRAFVSGAPCVVNSRAEYEALMSPAWAARARPLLPSEYSSCIVPLTCRGRRLGTLAASNARNGAFDAEAVQLLSEIADTLAPAVDNALAYREIADLKDRLAKEKRYLQSEVEASFEEVVGQSPAIERAVILSPGPELRIGAIELETASGVTSPLAHRRSPAALEEPRRLVDAERAFITQALQEAGWVVGGPAGAAARLGLSRTTLQGRMRKLGIKRPR